MTTTVDDEALSSILLHLKSNHQTNFDGRDEDQYKDDYVGRNAGSRFYSSSYAEALGDSHSKNSSRKQSFGSYEDDHTYSDNDKETNRKKAKNHTENIDFTDNALQIPNIFQKSNKQARLVELRKYFHLPLQNVAKKLGVCTTVVKKICRANNIHKWPYRQIKSLTCAIQSLEMASLNQSLGDEERKNMKAQIDQMQESIDCIMANPSVLSKSNYYYDLIHFL